MNLDNIIKLFESLGITMVIGERISFYDSETKEKMECFCTKSPEGVYLETPDIDREITLDKLLKDRRVIAKSRNKSLRFRLTTPIISRKRTNDVIISKMDFYRGESCIPINRCCVEYEELGENIVSVSSFNSNRDSYKTIMYSSGDIEFDKNGNRGYFDGTAYEEGADLSTDDMREVLDSTYLLSEISEYYSPLFPNMKASIDKAKQSRTI